MTPWGILSALQVKPFVRSTIKWIGLHDDVIKWKHFLRHWQFVRGIHRCPVISPHECQWRGALMFSLISAWIKGWVNNREAGDFRHHHAHYEVIVMLLEIISLTGLPFSNMASNWLMALDNRCKLTAIKQNMILKTSTHGCRYALAARGHLINKIA